MKFIRFFRFLAKTILLSSLYLVPAHATLWNINEVLSGSDGGFGYSGFHDASGSSVMSGHSHGSITDVISGTYNDATGLFDATLVVDPSETGVANMNFTLNGILNFGTRYLSSPGTMAIVFDNPTAKLINTTIGFMPGDVCCSGTGNSTPGSDPNSFDPASGILTLWGASGFDSQNTNGWYPNNPLLGMDIRVRMSTVPEPASFMLLGTGLLILGFLRQRQSRAITTTSQ